jgi:hypothetical protein
MHFHSGLDLKRIVTASSVNGWIQLNDADPLFNVVLRNVLNVANCVPVKTIEPLTVWVIAVNLLRTDAGPESMSVMARLSSSLTDVSQESLCGNVAGQVSIFLPRC